MLLPTFSNTPFQVSLREIRRALPLLLVFCIASRCFGQSMPSINIGIPDILNHRNSEYNAGPQNWAMVQDQRGVIYIANNDGLLEFDGQNWALFPLRNRTICRSLAIDDQGRIFAGGQGELGFFHPDSTGSLVFQPLGHLVPENHRNFDDVWQILTLEEEVIFLTSQKLFQLHGEQLTVDDSQSFMRLAQNQGTLYASVDGAGLKVKTPSGWALVPGGEQLAGKEVTAMLSQEKGLLITTLKNGIFRFNGEEVLPWKTEFDEFLAENRLYCATLLKGDQVALGTSKGGVLIIDASGLPEQLISKSTGLQNNNVLSLFQDRSQNLWLGLDNGIDYIEIASPLTHLYPDNELTGTAYSAWLEDSNLFFGTNNGLYVSNWQAHYNPFDLDRFRIVPGSEGQVWGVQPSGLPGKLLLAHNDGLFEAEVQGIQKLSPGPGSWKLKPLKSRPDYAVEGHYKGLALYQKSASGQWEFVRQLEGLEESCRFVTEDADGALWVSHPYRGAYRIELSPDLSRIQSAKLYNAQHGFPSDLLIHVFTLGEELVFTAERGIYSYNPEQDRFELHQELNAFLGEDRQTKRLLKDKDGNIWFVVGDEVGVLKITDKGLKKEIKKLVFPQLEGFLVGGFEFIYPLDQRNVFIGTEIGFVHFNPMAVGLSKSEIKVVLRSIKLLGQENSTLFSGAFGDRNGLQINQPESQIPVLQSGQNNLVFEFSATAFAHRDKIHYSYRLIGEGERWSEWTDRSKVEYTNIPTGTYTFEVKARDIHGTESKVQQYQFRLKPPWYRTGWAYLIYCLLFLSLFSGSILIPRKKYEREKARLRSDQEKTLRQKDQEHSIEMEQTERELMKLRNDQLQTEMVHQTKELASSTMHLVQKGEMLNKIREELIKAENNSTSPSVQKVLQQVIKMINADSQLDQDWEQFELYFDRVHVDFLERLKQKHSNLTPKDIRMCAYLRMNLSTKEIAPLMNISVRGVEISRYRLRKKLELPSETNLGEFMQTI